MYYFKQKYISRIINMIHETDTKNFQAQNNNLWNIQSVMPWGIWTLVSWHSHTALTKIIDTSDNNRFIKIYLPILGVYIFIFISRLSVQSRVDQNNGIYKRDYARIILHWVPSKKFPLVVWMKSTFNRV